jgi:hypothetical protein
MPPSGHARISLHKKKQGTGGHEQWYGLQAYSVKYFVRFRGSNLRGWSEDTVPNGMPRVSRAGTSWWRCCSVIWPGLIHCGRYATGWPAAWANWFISVWGGYRISRRCRMRTPNGPPNCTKTFCGPCLIASGRVGSYQVGAIAFDSRTSCSHWIQRPYRCA